ncbi:FG-GAP repeat domain-containing protein [Arthrobacter sp. QXT-31]|uniref:FG-GAP repeat domain-containing protein n=1 Tax=Arthrobacter sp. QXT-31 TaxID=1357915 RepID=UPI001F228C61|nr:VCBS repeat-containing protein [Arthrobacter sp. QXT-31]
MDTEVATDTRANTHHDVLWDGSTLYVASYRFVNDGLPAEPNFPSTMRRYSYNSSAKTYTLLGSSNINNHRVETLSIDKDSTGRLWATWQQGNRIYLNVTGTNGATWGTPFAHPASLANVSVDDNSALIAFGPGKMGLMWSRQVGDASDGMYWSSHVDGAGNTSWTTPVAAVKGQRTGDDHMNLKWLDSSSSRVFAAIKTSFTSASQPLIQLLAFNGTAWSATTIATVAECPNRVIVMIDESAQRVRTFATYPKPSGTTNAGVCTSSGGAIYEKSTPLDNISFTTTKTARIVDADQYVHNVTSTKQNLNSTARGTANSGLLLLADVNATSRYWHYYDPTGGAGGAISPSIRSAADVVASGPDGVLWNYPATGRGGFQARQKIGVGWSALNKGLVTDWNSDGVFDLIAQWKNGRLSLYPGRPGGGFAAARSIGTGWGGYHVTVGRWRTNDRYPGILAYDAAGTLWYYGNSTGSLLSPRITTGTGWGGLYLTMTDFDQDGEQDLLAKRSDGRLLLYRSTGTGGFVSEARPTVGTGWNSINSITAVDGFTTGGHGLMSRLSDGRLARYPFSKGTWAARTIVGSGWGNYNIFR